jgi:hypothetical protein
MGVCYPSRLYNFLEKNQMNERIQKFAEMHGFVNEHMTPGEKSDALKKYEKFAELIVRECADIATINAHQWASPGTYVLKHFGVEE